MDFAYIYFDVYALGIFFCISEAFDGICMYIFDTMPLGLYYIYMMSFIFTSIIACNNDPYLVRDDKLK